MSILFTTAAAATSPAAMRLQEAIRSRSARVAVIGLGYVGLPMAVELSEAGFHVFGLELDPDRCETLREGRSYITDLDANRVRQVVDSGHFAPTTDPSSLAAADVIIICVPTPLRKSKDPDLTAIIAAGDAVAAHLHAGQLVILESTTFPGTTEEVLLPALARTGLQVGEEFFLAFSPERIDPGNQQFSVRKITKLVGGVTPACTDLAVAAYQSVVEDVIAVSTPRVAEAAKLLENTFRSVNIGLANEMALICKHLDVDVWEVIDAAATKPFGFMPHYPGPGIGGHCIPLDPHYLSWKSRLSGYEPRFISLASEINGAMPQHVLNLISAALNDQTRCVRGSKVLLLGVAYKPNVGDVRESPALELLHLLHQHGARISYCDPHVPSVASGDLLLREQPLTAELLRESDCAVVITHHRDFDYEMIVRESKLVVDTRNATRSFAHLGQVRFL